MSAADSPLPDWAAEVVTLYKSDAVSQFILHGNTNDRLLLPLAPQPQLGGLPEFLLHVLLDSFDVVLSYDLGNGVRVEKGGELFNQWSRVREPQDLPRQPRPAVEMLTHYFRYVANLGRINQGRLQVGCLVKSAHLVAPALQGGLSYDLSALALLIRDWASDTLLTEHALATFLLTENLNDLHPLLVNNPRAAHVKVPLPSPGELCRAFAVLAPKAGAALANYRDDYDTPARQLAGATLSAVEGLLKTTAYRRQPLSDGELLRLKKELVEKECNGLIEFVDSKRTLDDVHGQEAVKAWLRQDIALWHRNDLDALPMGYLLCGPVGTGKTYLVDCLAGEAGVPVVRLKNFRDKWVGSTESNLEKIFRLLHALGRCLVFIDEADQALGRRSADGGDSGVSGRVYSMLAEEMSNPRNRGRVLWCLASSRPDLIEVDLKRPGRVDVKIPLFPTSTPAEGFDLVRSLCRKRGVELADSCREAIEPRVPTLLTPGAAEALAVKVYRCVRAQGKSPEEALRLCLEDYQNPVPRDVLDFQIRLAVDEASDLEFVPPAFRKKSAPTGSS
jgi:hypothetical protein